MSKFSADMDDYFISRRTDNMKMERVTVTAKTRKLSGKWKLEQATMVEDTDDGLDDLCDAKEPGPDSVKPKRSVDFETDWS